MRATLEPSFLFQAWLGFGILLFTGFQIRQYLNRPIKSSSQDIATALDNRDFPQISASVGNFILDRTRYASGGPRSGTFKISLTNQSVIEAQNIRCIVFSESHGQYFIASNLATIAKEGNPLNVNAEGPKDLKDVELIIRNEYGEGSLLLLDRLKPSGKSFLAILFQDSKGEIFLQRVRFSLDSHGDLLTVSGLRVPEFFSPAIDDPQYYERQVKFVNDGVFSRLDDCFVNAWDSSSFITKGEIVAKIVSAIFALIFVIATVVLGARKDAIKGKVDWRAISRPAQRLIANYLAPLAGQQITIVAPSKKADAEAANYGEQWIFVLRNAGWTVSKVEVPEAPKVPGLHYRISAPEHPALKPLIRAIDRSGVKIEQAFNAVGIPSLNPNPELVFVIGKAP